MIYRKELFTIASILIATQSYCEGFVTSPLPSFGLTTSSRSKFYPKASSDVVDAEFEYVNNNGKEDSNNPSPPASSSKTKVTTLIDISQSMDPEWKDLPVPFIDPLGNNYIDCTMVFMVDFENETYVLATPKEQSAAICRENTQDGTMEMLDVDDDDNIEIFEMAAAKLSQVFDDEVILKRTPRTLTIAGDLDQFTGNWREDLKIGREQTMSAEEMLKSVENEEEDFFDEFMKKELGAEYDRIMEEDDDVNDVSEDIMKLFEIPGVGTGEEDEEGIKELLDEIEADLKKDDEDVSDANDDIDENSGLRLLSFEGPDGNDYSLLELIQPVVIVGKEDPEVKTRRVLLTKEEFDNVTPRLEKYCRKELEEAGLKLSESL